MQSLGVLAGLLLVCLGAGYLGSLATAESVEDWYPRLIKPPGTPPDSVFGPVWTTLFVLMAVAAWQVWTRSGFEGARLADAIDAAGGGTDRADMQAVNLALRVKDEDYWHIPELPDPAVTSGTTPSAGASGTANTAPDPHSLPGTKVDINSAQVDALMSLPGIGEVRAHAIVRHREQNGDYASVDDLLGVPGIGPATLDALRDLVEAR